MMINDVKTMYKSQIGQLLDIQTSGGLWPNILTNNQTFPETSSSAMFLTGQATNVVVIVAVVVVVVDKAMFQEW